MTSRNMIFLCVGKFLSVFRGNEGIRIGEKVAKGEFWGKIDLLLLRFAFGFCYNFLFGFFFVKEKGNAYWKSLTTEAKKGASTKTFALDQ